MVNKKNLKSEKYKNLVEYLRHTLGYTPIKKFPYIFTHENGVFDVEFSNYNADKHLDITINDAETGLAIFHAPVPENTSSLLYALNLLKIQL